MPSRKRLKKLSEAPPEPDPNAAGEAPAPDPNAAGEAPAPEPNADEEAPDPEPNAAEEAPAPEPNAAEEAPAPEPNAAEENPGPEPNAAEEAAPEPEGDPELKEAEIDKDWELVLLCKGRFKTSGRGFRCLLKQTEKCDVYASKPAFVLHMRYTHQMRCDFDVIQGRKRTTDRVRPKQKPAGKLKQTDKNLGNFGARVFNAKKNKFKSYANKGLRDFYLDGIKVKTDAQKWKHVQKDAEKLYRLWRDSDDFSQTLNSCLSSTKCYWAERDPRVDAETEAYRVRCRSPVILFSVSMNFIKF
jgi:hypothetical protein